MKPKMQKDKNLNIITSPKQAVANIKHLHSPQSISDFEKYRTKTALSKIASQTKLQEKNVKQKTYNIGWGSQPMIQQKEKKNILNNTHLADISLTLTNKRKKVGKETDKQIQSKKQLQKIGSFKSPGGRRSQKTKEQDKTQKFYSEKDEKIKYLTEEVCKLETQLLRWKEENDDLREKMEIIQKEKANFEKKIFNYQEENRKLIKERVTNFNSKGKEMRDQVKAQSKKTCQIQTQTTISNIANELIFSQNQQLLINKQKQQQFNALTQKQQIIQQQRQLLHSQNLQLNQFYEKMFSKQDVSLKTQISTLQIQLSSLKQQIQQLKKNNTQLLNCKENQRQQQQCQKQQLKNKSKQYEQRQQNFLKKIKEQESIIESLKKTRPKVIIK